MKKKETYLYVLLLPHMDKEYNLSYKVKFGYTENLDSRMKNGYGAYYGEEGYQILHAYKGYFTKDIDETAIKQYLKKYSIFGTEWFRCCREVLEFFETYNTTEKLKQKISEIPMTRKYRTKFYKVNYMLIDYLLQFYYGDISDVMVIQNKREELENILREYSERDQYKYLKEEYDFDLNSFKKYENNRLKRNQENGINQKIEEFKRLKTSIERFKMLLEYSETTSKENFENFLELIPGKYKDYYTIVGPEIIRASGCDESKIKKRWIDFVSNSKIKDKIVSEIYKMFLVGQRYTKANIKNSLNQLYQKFGYRKKAKATDLGLYYIIKPVVTSEKKPGFEIIAKR